MAEDDTSSREGLLNTIRILEERIASYVKEKRPASTRLSTISIVSSSIAAALTIGPAAGGLTFAETVQHGLELSQSQTVWRALCIAATMVAVVAAISANLNKSNDLTGHIKILEGCSAELDVLRNRFELRKLSVGEALNRYEEIRARIPFIVVPPAGVEDPSARRPKDWVAGSLVTVLVVAFLVMLLTLGGLLVGFLRAGPPSPVPPTPASAPSSSAPTASRAVYAGRSSDGQVTLAIAVDNGKAAAYLCDGKKLEAWLQGRISGEKVSLSGRNGADLTGTINGQAMFGTVAARDKIWSFSADLAAPPAGIYQATMTINGVATRVGWVMLPGGIQAGVINLGGTEASAPQLNMATDSFTANGTSYRAAPVRGSDTVVRR
jgi:hypothetical protein